MKIQTVPGSEHSSECGGLQVYVLAVQQSLALLSILPVPSVRSTDRTEFLNRTDCGAAAATACARTCSWGVSRPPLSGRPAWRSRGRRTAVRGCDRTGTRRFGRNLSACFEGVVGVGEGGKNKYDRSRRTHAYLVANGATLHHCMGGQYSSTSQRQIWLYSRRLRYQGRHCFAISLCSHGRHL